MVFFTFPHRTRVRLLPPRIASIGRLGANGCIPLRKKKAWHLRCLDLKSIFWFSQNSFSHLPCWSSWISLSQVLLSKHHLLPSKCYFKTTLQMLGIWIHPSVLLPIHLPSFLKLLIFHKQLWCCCLHQSSSWSHPRHPICQGMPWSARQPSHKAPGELLLPGRSILRKEPSYFDLMDMDAIYLLDSQPFSFVEPKASRV